jgi:hypothetical protein
VGEEKRPIIVHSAAVTAHSKVLSALVNNGMAESQTRTATLDDIEEDDFLRFCQFAYTADYSTPSFTQDKIPTIEDEEIPAAPPPSPPPEDVDALVASSEISVWDKWGINVSQREYRSPSNLRTSFENRKFSTGFFRQQFLDPCVPLRYAHPSHNYTPVFLAHCRLYIFADKYGIEPLQQLVLHKLHRTLLLFQLFPERVRDVVELVRFAYTDEHTFSGGNDELRALVTIYAVLNIDRLDKSDSFLALLEDGGPFVRNFWIIVRNALHLGF